VSAEACIDMMVMAELRATTGDEFLAELIDTYCEETPRLLHSLQASLALGDAEAFRRHAHSIKSSSATFGASGLAAQARDLEMAGRDGDLSGADARVRNLVDAYATVERRLRELQHAS
jgi:HPt (histidine-containing phosphotransfer) domain-containing protein